MSKCCFCRCNRSLLRIYLVLCMLYIFILHRLDFAPFLSRISICLDLYIHLSLSCTSLESIIQLALHSPHTLVSIQILLGIDSFVSSTDSSALPSVLAVSRTGLVCRRNKHRQHFSHDRILIFCHFYSGSSAIPHCRRSRAVTVAHQRSPAYHCSASAAVTHSQSWWLLQLSWCSGLTTTTEDLISYIPGSIFCLSLIHI